MSTADSLQERVTELEQSLGRAVRRIASLERLAAKDQGDIENVSSSVHYHIHDEEGRIASIRKTSDFVVIKQGQLRIAERGIQPDADGGIDPAAGRIRLLKLANRNGVELDPPEVVPTLGPTAQLEDEPHGFFGWFIDLAEPMEGLAKYRKVFSLHRGMLNSFTGGVERAYLRIQSIRSAEMVVSAAREYDLSEARLVRLSQTGNTVYTDLPIQEFDGCWFVRCRIDAQPGETHVLTWRNSSRTMSSTDHAKWGNPEQAEEPFAESIEAAPESLARLMEREREILGLASSDVEAPDGIG